MFETLRWLTLLYSEFDQRQINLFGIQGEIDNSIIKFSGKEDAHFSGIVLIVSSRKTRTLPK